MLYHRVADTETDPQLLSVQPSHFDDHLLHLKNKYRVLSVEEFTNYLLKGKRFPSRSVLLTFDDGYSDNHIYARPLLEKHGLQALFYISTGYIDKQKEFWWDELEHRILLNPDLPDQLLIHLGDRDFELKKNEFTSLKSFYDYCLEYLKHMPSSEREKQLDAIRNVTGTIAHRLSHVAMSKSELISFSRSNAVVIGAHTRLHPSLSACPDDDVLDEAAGSKSDLESWLGYPIRYFSYPFGTGADFDERTIRVLQHAGFSHIAGNYPGMVHSRSPKTHFPRFLVRNWDLREFENRMHQFFYK